jgi:23S rRNA (cytosine1962-C5)-methyltransferase
LRVTAAAERSVRFGHPWLYADSIRKQNRPGEAGELAVVYDRRDRFCAFGLYDPYSPLRVRILHAGRAVTVDAAWWKQRLRRALDWRRELFDEQTTGYRCIHGENDGWPGLVLDRYDAVQVLKVYTAAWLPRLSDLTAWLAEALAPSRLVLRLSRNIQERAREAYRLEDGQLLPLPGATAEPLGDPDSAGSQVRPVVFKENGLRFEADVVHGQKTGFFLDQRDNRRRVEGLAQGRDVLNAFSYSGGFSLYAARGGATSVKDLDLNPHALAAGGRNFALNADEANVVACERTAIKADAFEWMEQRREPSFGLVILDPPSLAKREGDREGAIQAYGRLAAYGFRALRPGGVLVTASCSAHVTQGEFYSAVRQAARASGRTWREFDTTGHPPDHPAVFPEAHYLKCIYLRGE